MSAFSGIVGTGGIGAGQLFRFEQNRTLGRNESRLAHLLPNRDFCKLHIILHYVAALCRGLRVRPIGRVGMDAHGDELLRLMGEYGFDTSTVSRESSAPTLWSVCFIYPDGDGGNITTAQSASAHVTAADIRALYDQLPPLGGRHIALAAPEVPIEARLELLRLAKVRGDFTAASFLQEEAGQMLESGAFSHIDLVAVNRGEAAALCGCPESLEAGEIALRCAEKLSEMNGGIWALMTFGALGAYGWDGERLRFIPSLLRQPVRSTAGAGDSFLGGALAGLALGLDLLPEADAKGLGDIPLSSAAELGALVASNKVESADTIHFGITTRSLLDDAASRGIALSDALRRALGEGA